ncbi:hypothetical protein KOR42_35880 [Thalassoglobus neptunius]|uniref:HD/PDEase domain-containing protein n=1 Tax=Thalassoglobus neptunius TaxID=1938619 RepID=A0A5C5WLI8_9PLAN|nr:HD domain-containing protein [Thalassoglobus neptunius]TWT51540.1 hypothetical protein KOR42_35880 [Thalassoglobus neptunius]
MRSLEEIPELADLHSGRSLIRVPAEQNVPFTPRVRAIVDTAEFQRLNEISQLGLVSKVYPGARHTRFEHALGVYHNALLYLRQLSKDSRFRERVSAHQAEVLIVSSLLHDLGHWPFCHPIEDLGISGLVPHEVRASRYLSENAELSHVLREQWGIDPEEVLEILVPQKSETGLKLLRSILSGPIDVDKMDYLDRDSLHCGVPYGRNFDRQRLIQSLVLNEEGDGLAITEKGKTAAELMVFARYVMFSEVYWHHAVRSATSMFARAFYSIHEKVDLNRLFHSTDAEMVFELRAAAKNAPSETLIESLFGSQRILYKRAIELSHDQQSRAYTALAGRPYSEVVAITERLISRLNEEEGLGLSEMDLVLDTPPPHREVEFSIDILFPKQGDFRPLQVVSPVVDALATRQFDDWVKRVRVFIHPKHRDATTQLDWERLLLEAVSN